MTQQQLRIDDRTYDDIVKQTETLARDFTDWQPLDTELDAGGALVRIFARMMEVALDRLNRIPDRNFLAFLDLIGTQMLPPQPARVPITFHLAAGSPRDAFVPAKTRLAATPMEGETEEVLFEIDRPLFVTPVQLTSVFVREPDTGKYGDYTQDATTENGASFPVMQGDRQIPHQLYLASDDIFTLPDNKTVTIIITSSDAERLNALPISWHYWNGEIWQRILQDNITNTVEVNSTELKTEIRKFPTLSYIEINGVNAAWLRADLEIPLPRDRFTNGQTIERANLSIDTVLSGSQLLDIQTPFLPFGDRNPPSEFFLSVEEAFLKPNANVTFDISFSQIGIASSNINLEFSYWYDDNWQVLESEEIEDSTENFTQDGTVTFTVPTNWQPSTIQEIEARWLRVRIEDGTYTQLPEIESIEVDYTWDLPTIDRIQVEYTITADPELPELGFNNTIPIDFTKAFYPFGEQPRFNDAFYFSLKSEYAKPNVKVTIEEVELGNSADFPPNPSDDLELQWEVSNGQTWKPLGISTPSNTTSEPNRNFQDETLAFTKTQNKTNSISFDLPDDIAPRIENGEERYWVRARIVRGNYGTETAENALRHYTILREDVPTPDRRDLLPVQSVRGFVPGDLVKIAAGTDSEESHEIEDIESRIGNLGIREPTIIVLGNLSNRHPANTGVWLVSSAVLSPPSVMSFKVSYTAPSDATDLLYCQTENDFKYRDRTSESKLENLEFVPFIPTEEDRSTLYLGFDRPFANQLTTLYFRVKPIQYDSEIVDRLGTTQNREPARVVWEYHSPSGWKRLGVLDETETFSERGIVQFVAPKDLAATSDFGQHRYWLRVRLDDGEFTIEPRLTRILTNTTWATQAISIDREILGSSNGEPNQIFQTTKAPVLLGHTLEVEEPEMPSQQERDAIERDEGKDALMPVFDDGGNIRSVWVRWHQVPDFYGSSPRDRHYVLDYLTGIVRFGDGLSGAIPPQRRNNVRLSYRTGGGEIGNRPAETIVQLKSAIPYIDSAIDYEPSGGGADRETLDRVRERGPKFLRHRDRAVTGADFEDLAREASPDVARSKAITATDKDTAGRIGLILVPRSNDPQPIPTLDLIDRVEEYLNRRRTPGIDLWIAGPDWVKVTVTADIVPVSLEASISLDVKVTESIEHFLHPLTGGFDGRGWQFGRKPHKSDLYRAIESIEGVDRVLFLKIDEDPPSDTARIDRFLIYSGMHQITVSSEQ
ncbi:MAG: putative baseplate assembly protein [Cyanobacteria bacterium SBC]|nr:putative baseplate assembly protein [Cyanobacteria bacterium SBC]